MNNRVYLGLRQGLIGHSGLTAPRIRDPLIPVWPLQVKRLVKCVENAKMVYILGLVGHQANVYFAFLFTILCLLDLIEPFFYLVEKVRCQR